MCVNRRGWLPAEGTLVRRVLLEFAYWPYKEKNRQDGGAQMSTIKFPGTNPAYLGWGCHSKRLHHHRDHPLLCCNSCCPLSAMESCQGKTSHIRAWQEGLSFRAGLWRMVFSEREKQQLVTCQMAVTKSGQRLGVGLWPRRGEWQGFLGLPRQITSLWVTDNGG